MRMRGLFHGRRGDLNDSKVLQIILINNIVRTCFDGSPADIPTHRTSSESFDPRRSA